MTTESYLYYSHFDLISPDGKVDKIVEEKEGLKLQVLFENIAANFRGFFIEKQCVFFNLKSSLAQLGIEAETLDIELSPKTNSARCILFMKALSTIGHTLLNHLEKDCYVGKLFADDHKRKVRDPDYLRRMFGRKDRNLDPLLSLGGIEQREELILEKIEGRTIAYLPLKKGVIEYSSTIESFLPTLAKALKNPQLPVRHLLSLHQKLNRKTLRIPKENKMLLVQTHPLHIRTVFGKVADELLPKDVHHTSARILDPSTKDSGDIYELYGNTNNEIMDVPLEFYTLEPHREYIFFSDRDQLQNDLEDGSKLFDVMDTAPKQEDLKAALFIVKGEQLRSVKTTDWIIREDIKHAFPGIIMNTRQAYLADKFIESQPAYPFLKAIEDGLITSEGILLTKDFPSPLMKRMFLSYQVHRNLKAIYFYQPSFSQKGFFSHEDRAMLQDLAKFGIKVYWVDSYKRKILQYIPKKGTDSGLFVPTEKVQTFLNATTFGIYGSNLLQGDFEGLLDQFFQGIIKLKESLNHPLLNPKSELAIITGGGPGAMEVGNRIATKLGILSCANIVDFSKKEEYVHEQKQNPYIEAKMTYRLDKLVERQAEFNLDFPLILVGGIGTDFEYSLEEVRRKVGSHNPTPVLLFGSEKHWEAKITSRFQENRKNQTIKGSEWVSNCFYFAEDATEALYIIKTFALGNLPIGPTGPIYEKGFATTKDVIAKITV